MRLLTKSMMKKSVSWSMLMRRGWRESLSEVSSSGLAGSGLTVNTWRRVGKKFFFILEKSGRKKHPHGNSSNA